MLKTLYNGVLGMFYPARCAVCDHVLPDGTRGVCDRCVTSLEYVREPKCCRCGKPLETESEYCQDCQGKKVSFQYGYALFVYDSMLQESIARFKYHGRKEYAVFYAQAMNNTYGNWIDSVKPDVLVPVPVHQNRLKKRGYNQAALLARELGRLTNIPVAEHLLIRKKDTLPQKELSERERKQNLQDAFALGERQELNLLQECVIIIDDIYTTGATLEECSRVLKQVGIQRIYFLCVCIGKGF